MASRLPVGSGWEPPLRGSYAGREDIPVAGALTRTASSQQGRRISVDVTSFLRNAEHQAMWGGAAGSSMFAAAAATAAAATEAVARANRAARLAKAGLRVTVAAGEAGGSGGSPSSGSKPSWFLGAAAADTASEGAGPITLQSLPSKGAGSKLLEVGLDAGAEQREKSPRAGPAGEQRESCPQEGPAEGLEAAPAQLAPPPPPSMACVRELEREAGWGGGAAVTPQAATFVASAEPPPWRASSAAAQPPSPNRAPHPAASPFAHDRSGAVEGGAWQGSSRAAGAVGSGDALSRPASSQQWRVASGAHGAVAQVSGTARSDTKSMSSGPSRVATGDISGSRPLGAFGDLLFGTDPGSATSTGRLMSMSVAAAAAQLGFGSNVGVEACSVGPQASPRLDSRRTSDLAETLLPETTPGTTPGTSLRSIPAGGGGRGQRVLSQSTHSALGDSGNYSEAFGGSGSNPHTLSAKAPAGPPTPGTAAAVGAVGKFGRGSQGQTTSGGIPADVMLGTGSSRPHSRGQIKHDRSRDKMLDALTTSAWGTLVGARQRRPPRRTSTTLALSSGEHTAVASAEVHRSGSVASVLSGQQLQHGEEPDDAGTGTGVGASRPGTAAAGSLELTSPALESVPENSPRFHQRRSNVGLHGSTAEPHFGQAGSLSPAAHGGLFADLTSPGARAVGAGGAHAVAASERSSTHSHRYREQSGSLPAPHSLASSTLPGEGEGALTSPVPVGGRSTQRASASHPHLGSDGLSVSQTRSSLLGAGSPIGGHGVLPRILNLATKVGSFAANATSPRPRGVSDAASSHASSHAMASGERSLADGRPGSQGSNGQAAGGQSAGGQVASMQQLPRGSSGRASKILNRARSSLGPELSAGMAAGAYGQPTAGELQPTGRSRSVFGSRPPLRDLLSTDPTCPRVGKGLEGEGRPFTPPGAERCAAASASILASMSGSLQGPPHDVVSTAHLMNTTAFSNLSGSGRVSNSAEALQGVVLSALAPNPSQAFPMPPMQLQPQTRLGASAKVHPVPGPGARARSVDTSVAAAGAAAGSAPVLAPAPVGWKALVRRADQKQQQQGTRAESGEAREAVMGRVVSAGGLELDVPAAGPQAAAGEAQPQPRAVAASDAELQGLQAERVTPEVPVRTSLLSAALRDYNKAQRSPPQSTAQPASQASTPRAQQQGQPPGAAPPNPFSGPGARPDSDETPPVLQTGDARAGTSLSQPSQQSTPKLDSFNAPPTVQGTLGSTPQLLFLSPTNTTWSEVGSTAPLRPVAPAVHASTHEPSHTATDGMPLIEDPEAEGEGEAERPSAGSAGARMGIERWHEVVISGLTHPVTRERLLVVVQSDVSARVWAERQLAMVVEAEHSLLENIFPQHVIEHIAMMAAGAAAKAGRADPQAVESGALFRAASSGRVAVPEANSVPGGDSTPGRALALPSPSRGPLSRGPASPGGPNSNGACVPQIPITGDTFLHLATSHSALTVLFCDIQGFTAMCGVVKPGTVMAFLNDLYTRLDAMLDAFGVYKVETIGDCYMVAGGLMRVDEETGAVTVRSDDVDPRHAVRTVHFAKAVLRAAAAVRLPTTGEPVRLRVGIHSGPAMSGVVGTRMPRFCLFGDTINTASRMESTGAAGAIHVSQATRDLVPSEAWEPTGGVEAKGKGVLQTYMLRPPS
ncbi:hypothetical protein HYH03_000073 [Edaphochlamys debaryana]|uniref:Guanylate cyclase domain-containing protein n=1 Tax=Edaphochlamys debaryana TaxID=47281 RepID=A0A836C7A6_9CHLO|nr:hypothetical protein HYH03_000073 [Edaphochlamys debaryana]|eukprot:KAG2501567.1 hypothetical protein HYH03_000073 [Edaphochlamys debaryana]